MGHLTEINCALEGTELPTRGALCAGPARVAVCHLCPHADRQVLPLLALSCPSQSLLRFNKSRIRELRGRGECEGLCGRTFSQLRRGSCRVFFCDLYV